ncbi:response regulator [bacterium]|nr:response regulator [bacterium]MBU1074004.1 response regulator [bacterium]MBU1675673.1 response regulator [bacterium]
MDKHIRLLMVDDETEFLDSIAERLEQRGFDVTKACDGDRALEIAAKERFDLAVVDLRMPGMDGSALLEILKREHRFLEVIILTGHGSLESAFTCSKLGAFGYLQKPFDLDQLLETLTAAFQERMRKKYEHDDVRMTQLQKMALGSSPLGILRAMQELDDGEK